MALQISGARLESLCQESRQPGVLALQWISTGLVCVIVSLRLYCRAKFSKGLGRDDYAIVASLIVGLPEPTLTTKWVQAGLGKHIECLGPAGPYATIVWSIPSQAQHMLCLGLVKISLCLCVLRVIDRVERRIANFLWVNIGLVGAIHVAQVAVLLAECRPLNALWNPKIHGRCYSPITTYITTYIAFSLDAFTDLICAGIPTFVIYRMQMNRRTKIALCTLMGLGVLTAMCAVGKTISLKSVWSIDFTWNEVAAVNWACAEQALSVILVSLPILRPLFRNFFFLSKTERPPPKAPTIGGGRFQFQRRMQPDDSLLKSTNNGNNASTGKDRSSTVTRDESADQKLPQLNLAPFHVEWPMDLIIRVGHEDLETGLAAGP